MATKEFDPTQYFVDYHNAFQNGEYEKAIKVMNKLMLSDATNERALECKSFALIQLSRFKDVLVAVQSSKMKQAIPFHRAYCEYRLGNIQNAVTLLESIENKSIQEKELLAQVYYKAEKFPEAKQLYLELIKNCDDDYDAERLANLLAVCSCERHYDQDALDGQRFVSNGTYEQSYNSGCYLLANGEFEKAEEHLNEAEKQCQQANEELSPEDADVDTLMSIRTQLAYAKQMLGHKTHALQMYSDVIRASNCHDVSVMAVASNNIVTINKNHNIFESKKRLKTASTEVAKGKLLSMQNQQILYNQTLFHVLNNNAAQVEQCMSELNELYEDKVVRLFPNSQWHLLKAYRLKDPLEAVQYLEHALANDANISSEDVVTLKLCVANYRLGAGDKQGAALVLEELCERTNYQKHGLISTAVWLLGDADKPAEAEKVVNAAIEQSNAASHSNRSFGADRKQFLLKEAADYFTSRRRWKAAANCLESLLTCYKNSISAVNDQQQQQVLAQLANVYAKFDAGKAQQVSKSLPSLEDSARAIDALELEQQPIGVKPLTKVTKQAAQSPRSAKSGDDVADIITADGDKEKTKRKKKKKIRLPKKMDPNVQPDAERWLPKWQRAGYKQSQKRRERRTGQQQKLHGPQGGSADTKTEMSTFGTTPTQSSSAPKSGGSGGGKQRRKRR